MASTSRSGPEESAPGDFEPSTLDLARAARGGTPAEFARLYERVAPAVQAWACLRLRPRMRAQIEPEDLAQEIWMRALALFPTSDASHGNFRAWVFSVAKLVMLELLRRQERASIADGSGNSAVHAWLANVPEDVTSATHRIARSEVHALFLERVNGLEEEERALVIHCGLEGLTCAEAAARLGISSDAALKRWQRLRARLGSDTATASLLAAE